MQSRCSAAADGFRLLWGIYKVRASQLTLKQIPIGRFVIYLTVWWDNYLGGCALMLCLLKIIQRLPVC